MNRLKKELRRRGIKLESDYLCLPFYVKGKSFLDPGYICVEAVVVHSETATVITMCNVGDKHQRLTKSGELVTEYVF